MVIRVFVCFAVVWFMASDTFAHSRIDTSVPAHGAVLAEAPAEVSFSFTQSIRLTQVELTYAERDAVTLDLDGQKRFDRKFALPLQSMGAGTYRIEWRGLAKDGHAMQGELTFMVE
ncbi:MAG: copper resistance protein CopC [Rhodobacteraceae bacterium]|nr:copper resistance protein CopC [Paracoccaceae bacterium]